MAFSIFSDAFRPYFRVRFRLAIAESSYMTIAVELKKRAALGEELPELELAEHD